MRPACGLDLLSGTNGIRRNRLRSTAEWIMAETDGGTATNAGTGLLEHIFGNSNCKRADEWQRRDVVGFGEGKRQWRRHKYKPSGRRQFTEIPWHERFGIASFAIGCACRARVGLGGGIGKTRRWNDGFVARWRTGCRTALDRVQERAADRGRIGVGGVGGAAEPLRQCSSAV